MENKYLVNSNNKVFRIFNILILLNIFYRQVHSECTTGDLLVNPNSCSSYYLCNNNNLILQQCPSNLLFNPLENSCDWPENVQCKDTAKEMLDDTTTISTATTTTTTKKPPQPQHSSCPEKDPNYTVHLPHPNCTKFYKCLNGQAYELSCPNGLHWNIEESWCDYPDLANCTENAAEQQEILNITTPLPPQQPPAHNYTSCPEIDPNYTVHLPHPNCAKFYKCFKGQAYEHLCPDGLDWNDKQNWCDYPVLANCIENAAVQQPTLNITTALPSQQRPAHNYTSCSETDPNFTVHLPHPNCAKFYKCVNGDAIEMSCPIGQHWSVNNDWCDFPNNANCIENAAHSQP